MFEGQTALPPFFIEYLEINFFSSGKDLLLNLLFSNKQQNAKSKTSFLDTLG